MQMFPGEFQANTIFRLRILLLHVIFCRTGSETSTERIPIYAYWKAAILKGKAGHPHRIATSSHEDEPL